MTVKPLSLILVSLLMSSLTWAGENVDLIVATKSTRKLTLMKNDQVVREYSFTMGWSPEGHKEQEGDERTPEGRYFIKFKNPNSDFHKALQISYPSEEDRKRARENGVDPGDFIMIHGQPNWWTDREDVPDWARSIWDRVHTYVPWTDGCLAVTNEEIDEIYELVDIGTPIYIFP